MKLSVLVPVYNESATVVQVMHTLASALPDAQIIYIDDGSHDGSLALLNDHVREQDLVLTKENGGKGSAVRMGLQHAHGTYTVIQDADLEYDPRELLMLLHCAEETEARVVFGSRFLQNNPNAYKSALVGNKILSGWLSTLFRTRITDAYTCYKLLKTDLFRQLALQSNGFELEAEICARCLKRKERIIEIPISYHPRTIEEGKKIGWKDGFKGLLTMSMIRVQS